MQLKISIEGSVEEKVKTLRCLAMVFFNAAHDANYKAELIRRQALGRAYAKKKQRGGK